MLVCEVKVRMRFSLLGMALKYLRSLLSLLDSLVISSLAM